MLDAIVIAAEGPNGPILPADINEVWWSSAAFLLVVAGLVWKAGPPARNAWNRWIDRIRDEVEGAESERAAAEAELAEVRARVADADAERERIRADALATAEAVKAQLRQRAEEEAAAIRARGEADIRAMREQAEADLRSEIGGLALGAAEQVVVRSLDERTQRELVEAYIARVGAAS
jgi:F-type H+-transporting ATPase subunit b